MQALWEIQKYQKTIDLSIPKMPFLWLVWEILQRDHAFHLIQAGAMLVVLDLNILWEVPVQLFYIMLSYWAYPSSQVVI